MVGLDVGTALGLAVGLALGLNVAPAFVGARDDVGALVGDLVGDWHVMPTSSLWAQLWLPTPRWLQADNRGSLPPQLISSSKMLPLPPPTVPKPVAKGGYPASLHATLASVWWKRSSQTVPHAPFRYTSTRLWDLPLTDTRRMSGGQVTPTSSLWSQLWLPTPPWLQADNRSSLPLHFNSSSQMLPMPPPTMP